MKIILKNFIDTLLRYKVSSLLNILGLALAFASMYILLVQVNWELTYNHSIQDAERVYAIEAQSGFEKGAYNQMLSRPIGERLAKLSPYIECGGTGGFYPNPWTILVKRGADVKEFKYGGTSMSVAYLDVFGFESVDGSLHDISKPGSVIIPQSAALKFGLKAGDTFYVGKDIEQGTKYDVVAIYKDFKDNTSFAGNPIFVDMGDDYMDDYGEWGFAYFVKLKSASDKELVEAIFNKYAEKEFDETDADFPFFRLIPLQELYFATGNGNKSTVYTFLFVAILIVVIALINFVNFFYALIPVRIRKVNTLKIFGSPMYALRLNFIVEALGLVFLSLLIAWYVVYMVQTSSFADYISTSLAIGENPLILAVTLLSAFGVAVLASVYPAYYITSFPMAFVIKGAFASSKNGKRLRMGLLGVQFIISISLIVSAIFMKVQHNHMMNYDMGFNRENILSVWMSYDVAEKNSLTYREKLLTNPQIKDVTAVEGNFIAESRMGWGRDIHGTNPWFQCFPVAPNFLDFMGIEMAEGRAFNESDDLKVEGTFIFNETAKKEFELTLGEKISGHYEKAKAEVVGICKDFNFKPLQFDVAPLALYVYGAEPWRPLYHVYVRTTANADLKSVIDYMQTTMVALDPTITKEEIHVEFFDEELGNLYYKEKKQSNLLTLFSVISIVISLMGVFGLVLFETQYRRKEIAIRRVHGASRREILLLFNRKYVRMVLICFVIAIPVSYYLLHKWASAFAYRAELSWWIFAVALLFVLLITVVTVTVRSLKAANEDPALSIKTE